MAISEPLGFLSFVALPPGAALGTARRVRWTTPMAAAGSAAARLVHSTALVCLEAEGVAWARAQGAGVDDAQEITLLLPICEHCLACGPEAARSPPCSRRWGWPPPRRTRRSGADHMAWLALLLGVARPCRASCRPGRARRRRRVRSVYLDGRSLNGGTNRLSRSVRTAAAGWGL